MRRCEMQANPGVEKKCGQPAVGTIDLGQGVVSVCAHHRGLVAAAEELLGLILPEVKDEPEG